MECYAFNFMEKIWRQVSFIKCIIILIKGRCKIKIEIER